MMIRLIFTLFILGSKSGYLAAQTSTDATGGKIEAYKLCESLEPRYRPGCASVVTNAKSLDDYLVQKCKTLTLNYSRVYCLDRGRNSTFEKGALDVCFSLGRGFAHEDDIIECILKISKAPVVTQNSARFYVYTTNGYASYEELYSAMELQAQRSCSGWTNYQFEKSNWKRDDVWSNGGLAHCRTIVFCSKKLTDNYSTIEYSGVVQ